MSLLILAVLSALSSSCRGSSKDPDRSRRDASGENMGDRQSASDGARADIKVGGQTFQFTSGKCGRGQTDETMVINIGELQGDDYFGFGAGRNPGAYEADEALKARTIKGGGQFAGRFELLIVIQHDGQDYSPVPESARATIAPDHDSGDFTGTTPDGVAIAGSFKC